jgi:hypothetical protein
MLMDHAPTLRPAAGRSFAAGAARVALAAALATLAVPLRAAEAPGAASSGPKSISDALAILGKVGPLGADNDRAAKALRRLVTASPDDLPLFLIALDQATPLGANWIRAAVETVADRALAQGAALPAAKLEAFFADRSHSPRARRLAYEWLLRVDAGARERLMPTLLDDPSVELRRDAVAQALAAAAELAKQKDPAAPDAYRRALTAARDEDQVKSASDALKELGQGVNLGEYYGFVRAWRLIGPFDNAGKRGYRVAYPPEKNVDLSATLDGKLGTVRWTEITTKEELGLVDLNKLLVKEKGALAYALTTLDSPREQDAQVRVGSGNAIKLWLNGLPVYEREVYHAFVKMDQYVVPIHLRAGKNDLLIKVCQNEQTEEWAADWNFQLRVCDATGGAIAIGVEP